MKPNNLENALSSSERRNADRKKLIVNVHYNGGDTLGIANTRDIGIGGLYMTTKENFTIGTTLTMKLTIGERDVTINGIVVYLDDGTGVGIRFHNLGEEYETLLKKELNLA
jgi:Tfp pilus assembly protein PilZ